MNGGPPPENGGRPPASGGSTRASLRIVARDSLALAPSYVVPGVASLLSVPILFAALGSSGYGAWALMFAIANGVPQVTTSWLEGLLLRVGHRQGGGHGALSYAASSVASFASGALLAAIFIPSATPAIVVATACLTLSVGGYLLLVAWLQSTLRFATVSAMAAIRAVAGAILGIAAAVASHDPALAILGIAVGFGLGIAVPLAMARLRPRTGWAAERDQPGPAGVAPSVDSLRYGTASAVYAVGLFILSVGDRFVLSATRPLAEVGVYAATYAICDLVFRFVPSAPIAVIRQRLFRSWDASGSPQTGALLLVLASVLAWAMGVLVLGLVVVGPRIRVLPLEQDLTGPISLGLAAFVLASMIGLLYSAQVRQGGLAARVVAAAALNVALNVLLDPWIGALGAALSTAIAYSAFLVLNLAGTGPFLRLVDRRTLFLASMAAAGATAAAIAGTSSVLPLWILSGACLAAGIPALVGLYRTHVDAPGSSPVRSAGGPP